LYITAMWLRAAATGARGVNVSIYRHPHGLPYGGDARKIAENPEQGAPPIRYQEIKSGGNSVEAYLDLILEDKHYDLGELKRTLEHLWKNRFLRRVENPLQLTEVLGSNAELKIVFSVNLGFEDPDSQRAIFSLLCGTAITALEQKGGELAA
jgi:hypothetical protein